MPIQHLDSVLVNLVINEEPGAVAVGNRGNRLWSLNLVVHGKEFPVGRLVTAVSAEGAAVQFAQMLTDL